MDDPKCKHCRYWLQQAPEDISGQCRRFPPSLAQTPPQQEAMDATGAGTFVGVWPDTLAVDWCGEFQPRRRLAGEQPLAILGLTKQTLNLLHRAGIKTVGDLTGRTVAELRVIHGFGDARMREVQDKLALNHLSLKT